jgi:hypothetical protein
LRGVWLSFGGGRVRLFLVLNGGDCLERGFCDFEEGLYHMK